MPRASLPPEIVTHVLMQLEPATNIAPSSIRTLLAVATASNEFRRMALDSKVWRPHLDSVWTLGNTEEGRRDAYTTFVRRARKDRAIYELVHRIAAASHGRLPLYRQLDAIADGSPEECLDELAKWAEYVPYTYDGEGEAKETDFLSEGLAASICYQRLLQIKALETWRKAGSMRPLEEGIHDEGYEEFVECLEESVLALSAFGSDRNLDLHKMHLWGRQLQAKVDEVVKLEFEDLSGVALRPEKERLELAVSVVHKILRVMGVEDRPTDDESSDSDDSDDEETSLSLMDYLLGDQAVARHKLLNESDEEEPDDMPMRQIDPQMFGYYFIFVARRLPPALRFRCVPETPGRPSSPIYVRVSLDAGKPVFFHSTSEQGVQEGALLLDEEAMIFSSGIQQAAITTSLMDVPFWVNIVCDQLQASWTSHRHLGPDYDLVLTGAALYYASVTLQQQPDFMLIDKCIDALSNLTAADTQWNADHIATILDFFVDLTRKASLPSGWDNVWDTPQLEEMGSLTYPLRSRFHRIWRAVEAASAMDAQEATGECVRRRLGDQTPAYRVGELLSDTEAFYYGVVREWEVLHWHNSDEPPFHYTLEGQHDPDGGHEELKPSARTIIIGETEDCAPAETVLEGGEVAAMLNKLPKRVGRTLARYTLKNFNTWYATEGGKCQLDEAWGVKFTLSARGKAEYPDD